MSMENCDHVFLIQYLWDEEGILKEGPYYVISDDNDETIGYKEVK